MRNNDSPLIFTRKASGLVKGLNWFDIFVLVISAPAGSGILYYSVSTASTYPGGNVGLSFLIGMFIILPIIFLAAISSNMIPRSGSLYVFISRTINPGIGFFTAVLFFLGYTLSIGVVAFVVTQVVGGILVNSGMASNSQALKDLGQLLQNPKWAAVGGTLLVILTWFIVTRGIRVFRMTMRVLFYVTVLAALITIVYFFLNNHESTAQLFNKVWGANAYTNIMILAKDKGWVIPAFSWQSTFNLLLVVLFSYAGLELISYASGEVAQEKKKLIRGYIIASISLALIYTSIAFSVSSSFGDFLGAYDYVFKNHPEDLKKIMPAISPSVPFYISSIIPNIWVGVTISLALSLWLVNTMIPYFFAPSRLIFALAMDRAIPESMTNVNSKTGAPTNASHLTLVFALLGVFFNLLNVGTVLGTILFCAVFVYWLYGLSAVLLPFKNPELYDKCPVKFQLFGIPFISIIGALTFGIGWFVIFIATAQMTMNVAITLSIILLISVILYALKLKRNQKENINIDLIYSQLPPE
jgi:amino acid transporter